MILNYFKNFFYGTLLPYHALRLILKHKSLMGMSLLPILLTFLLYYYVLSQLNPLFTDYLQNYLLSFGVLPKSWLSILLSFIFQLFILLISVLTFTFTSTLIASPLNDFLAERSENYIPQLSPAPKTSFFNMIHLLYIDLAKSLTLLMIGFLSILFFWVPLLNIIGFTITFLLISFQYITYPQTRRGLNFKKSVIFLKYNFSTCLGFGGILFFLFSIPFLSSFILPLAVVGGTLLYAHGEKNLPHYE